MNLESLMVKDCFTILLLERPSVKCIGIAPDVFCDSIMSIFHSFSYIGYLASMCHFVDSFDSRSPCIFFFFFFFFRCCYLEILGKNIKILKSILLPCYFLFFFFLKNLKNNMSIFETLKCNSYV